MRSEAKRVWAHFLRSFEPAATYGILIVHNKGNDESPVFVSAKSWVHWISVYVFNYWQLWSAIPSISKLFLFEKPHQICFVEQSYVATLKLRAFCTPSCVMWQWQAYWSWKIWPDLSSLSSATAGLNQASRLYPCVASCLTLLLAPPKLAHKVMLSLLFVQRCDKATRVFQEDEPSWILHLGTPFTGQLSAWAELPHELWIPQLDLWNSTSNWILA